MSSEPLPPYSSSGKGVLFVPTIPSFNRRYNQPTLTPEPQTQNQPSLISRKTRIPSLFDCGGSNLPDGWEVCQHPEGDISFYHPHMHLVTTADIRSTPIRDILSTVFTSLMQQFGHEDLNPIAIYLNPLDDPSSANPTVEYYLVDHKQRQVFWLHDVSPASIGFPDFSSQGQLKSLLTPEYWTHVDYFPLHMPLDCLLTAEEELMLMLAQGKLDAMTSPGSTCPYSAQECSEYLKTLDGNRRFDNYLGYRTTCVARLWNAMARARHINNFGLTNPRLDRLQGLHEFRELAYRPSFKLSLCEALTFLSSIPIWERLMDLFNGRVVYQRHWAVFFKDMRRNWFLMGALSTGTFACDIFLLSSRGAGPATMASASFAGAAIFASVYLHHLHPEYKLGTGPEISSYVMKYEDYYHGLRPLALALAVPQALTVYAVVCLLLGLAISTVQHARSVEEAISVVLALSLGAVPILLTSSFFAPASPAGPPRPSFWSQLFSRSDAVDPTKRQA